MQDRAALDAALLSAHERGDQPALIRLYEQAAELASDECEAGFFLTQAYVFALSCGDPMADGLHTRLVAAGRDE